MLTASIALSLWAFLRAIDEDEPQPRWWAFVMAASLGVSLLFKSLVGVVFPIAAALIYLGITRQFFSGKVWKALHPLSGALVVLADRRALAHPGRAAQSSLISTFTMRSAPGEYHGFLWFYFINEQLLRFLNTALSARLRYGSAPLLLAVPSAVAVSLERVSSRPCRSSNFKPRDRAGKVRLLALCWTGFILVFFTFSTTQEYYSMPCYPALALLLGSAMAAGGNWIRYGTRVLCGICAFAAGRCSRCFSVVESSHAGRYFRGAQLKSGRLQAFARPYGRPDDRVVRLSAAPAAGGRAGVSAGSGGHVSRDGPARISGHGADGGRVFSGRAHRHGGVRSLSFLAAAGGSAAPRARGQAHRGSSLLHFFLDFLLHQSDALLLNGRFNNLVYGSYAPGAPNVFIDDAQWKTLWLQPDRYYLVITQKAAERLKKLVEPRTAHRRGAKRRQVAADEPSGGESEMMPARPETYSSSIAAIPFIYYLIAIYSSWRYFRQPASAPDPVFTPPVSILKPFRGLDPDAYENLASFCRLDYPEL